jgi:hypothetical protein
LRQYHGSTPARLVESRPFSALIFKFTLNIKNQVSAVRSVFNVFSGALGGQWQPSPYLFSPDLLSHRADFYFIVFFQQEAPKSSSRHAQQPEERGQGHHLGGIFGVVAGSKTIASTKVADQVKIEISKSAIVSKQPEE